MSKRHHLSWVCFNVESVGVSSNMSSQLPGHVFCFLNSGLVRPTSGSCGGSIIIQRSQPSNLFYLHKAWHSALSMIQQLYQTNIIYTFFGLHGLSDCGGQSCFSALRRHPVQPVHFSTEPGGPVQAQSRQSESFYGPERKMGPLYPLILGNDQPFSKGHGDPRCKPKSQPEPIHVAVPNSCHMSTIWLDPFDTLKEKTGALAMLENRIGPFLFF